MTLFAVGYVLWVAGLLELELRREPYASRSARDAAADVLVDLCDLRQASDVLTVISELVTNAVRHTAGGCTLRLLLDGDQVVVEVCDSDTRAPQVSRGAGELGHGLGVVQSLATRWGIDRTPDGKCVWAEMSIGSQHSGGLTDSTPASQH